MKYCTFWKLTMIAIFLESCWIETIFRGKYLQRIDIKDLYLKCCFISCGQHQWLTVTLLGPHSQLITTDTNCNWHFSEHKLLYWRHFVMQKDFTWFEFNNFLWTWVTALNAHFDAKSFYMWLTLKVVINLNRTHKAIQVQCRLMGTRV